MYSIVLYERRYIANGYSVKARIVRRVRVGGDKGSRFVRVPNYKGHKTVRGDIRIDAVSYFATVRGWEVVDGIKFDAGRELCLKRPKQKKKEPDYGYGR